MKNYARIAAALMIIVGVCGLCVSCASIDVKEEYSVMYKITETASANQNGALTQGVMPFFKDDQFVVAIECARDPKTISFMFTVVYIYDTKDGDTDEYLLNTMDIKIDNGKAIALGTTEQKRTFKKGLFGKDKVMETLTLRLESGTVQSLRTCGALTLLLLGQTREMQQEAIGKIKGFIEKYSAANFG